MRFLACALIVLSTLAGTAAAQLDAASSEARSAYRQGLLFERRNDVPAANTQFQIACEGGDMRGCLAAANNYRIGNTIPQDFSKAAGWYAIACEGGAGEGCSALGYLANKGLGLDQDYAVSFDYYERGCDRGDLSGCAGAGNLLITGTGIPHNRTEGARLLRQACSGGFEWSCTRLRDLGQPLELGQ